MTASTPGRDQGGVSPRRTPAVDEGREAELRSAPAGASPLEGEEAAWQRAVERGLCLHCESPLGPAWSEDEGPFCCRGCRTVYHLIHGQGLDRFYDIARGRQAPPAQLGEDTFAWLDRLLVSTPRGPGGTLQLTLDLQGVHCAACVWLLEELFRRQAGGVELRVNPSLGKVDVCWDPSAGELTDYLREAERFGYRFGPPRKKSSRASRALLWRMAVCIAIALNVMMYSLTYYFGLAEGEELFTAFGRLSLILATVSVLVGGQVFFQGALAGLRRGIAHLDLPIALGMLLAYVGSVWAYVSGGPEAVYFDSLTIFVALMLVGRWAQERILERNRNSLLETSGAEQIYVKRQTQAGLESVVATEVRIGDELWIAPGDLLPVAGVLLRRPGEASLDWITGESDLQHYDVGDTIPAGAFNAGVRGLAVSAVEDFADSRLGDLLRQGPARGEAAEKAWKPRWWSLVATWYVTAVLAVAALGFVVWVHRGVQPALEVTVAILVVTCPCALGLATPLAEELTFYALRRRGVFVRHGELMDKALEVRKVLLDKTGTLTLGRLSLDGEARRQLWALEPAHRSVLESLVARSNHPVSRALAEALGTASDAGSGPLLDDLVEEPGRGLRLESDGQVYRLGRAGFALEGSEAGESGGSEDRRLTLFTRDGEVLGRFGFTEDFKADADDEVGRLMRSGYRVSLLSGDDPAKVRVAAKRLGLDAKDAVGALSPEGKAARIRAIDRQDTMMVGDGLNDSPSFEAALCAGTPAIDRPVLPGKADFFFLGDGIAAVRWTLAAARRLRTVIRDNLGIAIAYNLLAVGLCLAGLVTPVVAAVLMPLSSIGVVSLTAVRMSGRRLGW